MIVADARVTVADHLDDSDNDRWSETQIDNALNYAVSQCVDEYVSSGGDRLDQILDTTSTTSGEVDFSTIDPLLIKGVSFLQGSIYWPIKAFRFEEKNRIDDIVRTLQIRHVRKPSVIDFSTDPADYLLQIPILGDPSWQAMDHWICAKAARFCAIKDAESRPELKALEEDMRYSVMSHTKIPRSVPFPARRPYISQMFGYVWNQPSKKLIVIRAW